MKRERQPKKSHVTRQERLFLLTADEIQFLKREHAMTGLTLKSMCCEMGNISVSCLRTAMLGGGVRESKIIVIREWIKNRQKAEMVS